MPTIVNLNEYTAYLTQKLFGAFSEKPGTLMDDSSRLCSVELEQEVAIEWM